MHSFRGDDREYGPRPKKEKMPLSYQLFRHGKTHNKNENKMTFGVFCLECNKTEGSNTQMGKQNSVEPMYFSPDCFIRYKTYHLLIVYANILDFVCVVKLRAIDNSHMTFTSNTKSVWILLHFY